MGTALLTPGWHSFHESINQSRDILGKCLGSIPNPTMYLPHLSFFLVAKLKSNASTHKFVLLAMGILLAFPGVQSTQTIGVSDTFKAPILDEKRGTQQFSLHVARYQVMPESKKDPV